MASFRPLLRVLRASVVSLSPHLAGSKDAREIQRQKTRDCLPRRRRRHGLHGLSWRQLQLAILHDRRRVPGQRRASGGPAGPRQRQDRPENAPHCRGPARGNLFPRRQQGRVAGRLLWRLARQPRRLPSMSSSKGGSTRPGCSAATRCSPAARASTNRRREAKERGSNGTMDGNIEVGQSPACEGESMTSLGQVCLLAAMVASGYSAFACAAGGWRRHLRVCAKRRLGGSGRRRCADRGRRRARLGAGAEGLPLRVRPAILRFPAAVALLAFSILGRTGRFAVALGVDGRRVGVGLLLHGRRRRPPDSASWSSGC